MYLEVNVYCTEYWYIVTWSWNWGFISFFLSPCKGLITLHNYDSLIPHMALVLSGHVSVSSFQVFIYLFPPVSCRRYCVWAIAEGACSLVNGARSTAGFGTGHRGSTHWARNRDERLAAAAVDENKRRFILASADGTGVFVLRLDFNQVV